MATHEPKFRTPTRFICSCATAVYSYFVCCSICLAGVDICQQPIAYSHLSIAHHNSQKSSFENRIGETRQENNHLNLLFSLNDSLAIGVGHRYTILNARSIEPQTNGHLHTVFFPLHRYVQSNHGNIRFSVAPALSASSNVFPDPGEYNSDTLQLLAAVVWSKPLSERTEIRYGICGDHRFGRYAIYPLVSVDWQPHADWRIQLGFPNTQVTYQVSKSLSSSLRIAPDGNEWHVRDRSLERQSQLIYESFLLEWAFNWEAHDHFVVTASVGRQFRNRFEITLMNDSRVRLHGDPVARVGAALEWRF
jgi:hypothetical protein